MIAKTKGNTKAPLLHSEQLLDEDEEEEEDNGMEELIAGILEHENLDLEPSSWEDSDLITSSRLARIIKVQLEHMNGGEAL